VRMPHEITIAALESLDVEHSEDMIVPRGTTNLRGTRISGTGDVSGRVRVLRHASEIESFQKGEILVARFTDPTWMSVFPLARGLITEVGGWLSHAAIQAREYDITGIVGAAGALDGLVTGEIVCLRADGSIERVENRRTEGRVPVSIPVEVKRRGEAIEARLGDVSPNGALVHVGARSLVIGEDVDFTSLTGDSFGARVMRNGTPGVYGVRFHQPIDQQLADELGVSLANRIVQGAA